MLVFCLLILSFINNSSSARYYFKCKEGKLPPVLSEPDREYCCPNIDGNHGPWVVKWRSGLAEEFRWGCKDTLERQKCFLEHVCGKQTEIGYLGRALDGTFKNLPYTVTENAENYRFLVIGEKEHDRYTTGKPKEGVKDPQLPHKFPAAFVKISKLYTINQSGSVFEEDLARESERLCRPIIMGATYFGCDFIRLTKKAVIHMKKDGSTRTQEPDYFYVCMFKSIDGSPHTSNPYSYNDNLLGENHTTYFVKP